MSSQPACRLFQLTDDLRKVESQMHPVSLCKVHTFLFPWTQAQTRRDGICLQLHTSFNQQALLLVTLVFRDLSLDHATSVSATVCCFLRVFSLCFSPRVLAVAFSPREPCCAFSETPLVCKGSHSLLATGLNKGTTYIPSIPNITNNSSCICCHKYMHLLQL